jgi:T-complex protein 1 subunit alpha
VMAALSIANIVKSSLGPVGLDKMLVDEVGDVTITNDGATILKQLEVQHPAAKVLVELSNLQDQEVGDGTTSVVILASEILAQANELIKNHVHPTSIITGLLAAKKESCKYIAKNMAQKVADLGDETILNCAKTSISSKILSADSDFFAKLAVDAVSRVQSKTGSYSVRAISILKAHGKSILDSHLVDGYALNAQRSAQGMPTSIQNAKIAMLDIDLRKSKLKMGIQVLVSDPKKLADIRQKETDLTNDRIKALLAAGANVVLTTKGIDDTSLKLLVDAGVLGVRRCSKAELKAIARVTGGELITSLADEEGGETVDPACFGTAASVQEKRVGDGELLYILGCENTRAQTIVLRGANDYMLDEIERSLHDCMMVVKRVLESKSVVPGGGCIEGALSIHMETLADTMGSREQLAVAAFARALLIIPKTLAVNGAYDATDLVAKLRAYHNSAQSGGKLEHKWTGLDLEKGKVRNNLKAGVLEPAIGKIKMIRFATEAAVTILRIDDAIKLNPAQNPNAPQHDGY